MDSYFIFIIKKIEYPYISLYIKNKILIHYLCKKRKNRYNSIKLEKDFTHFSSFTPEAKYI